MLVLCVCLPEDVLMKDTGECAICLDELLQGDTIARLPCLCIYHKGYQTCSIAVLVLRGSEANTTSDSVSLFSCIDEWFDVNRSCPEHPSD